MELTLSLPQGPQHVAVTGAAERNLKLLREAMGVSIIARNGSLRLSGDSLAVGRAAYVIEQLTDAAQRNRPLSHPQLLDIIASADHLSRRDQNADVASSPTAQTFSRDSISITAGLEVYLSGRRVKALTQGQRVYLESIFRHDLTICTGPAGTGKTYLAVAAAVHLLKRGGVRKIVLVRPAVEAGEKLGFLPGSMQEKVNPYLRPLLDALHDMMEFEQVQRFIACDLIEVVPLAFMRGRTLNDGLIILDEAQNTTRAQMLMFLTRLGHGSKMVVTGDASQTDLPDGVPCGLIDAIRRLKHTRGVAACMLDQADIVRHHLVQRIIAAYGESSRSRRNSTQAVDISEDTNTPNTDVL